MKENDWKLKDKKFMVGDGYALLDTYTPEENESGLFSSEDVETLRRKLIEDLTYEKISFKNLDGSKILTDNSQLYKEEGRMDAFAKAIEIINKRFGINEIEIKEEEKCLQK